MLLLILAWLPPPCLTVPDDRLRAADLVAVIPALAKLPPATELGWSPAPGTKRIIDRRAAERWVGAPFDATGLPICIDRPLEGLSAASLQGALKTALASSEEVRPESRLPSAAPAAWTMELLDWPRHALPAGKLRFDIRAVPRLPRAAQIKPVLWRGVLVTPQGRQYPIWARVRISHSRRVLRTTQLVAAGQALNPAMLAVTEADEYPLWPAPLSGPDATTGRQTRRTLPAGAPIMASDLAPRPAIRRGDEVLLEAASAGAQLRIPVRAEADAQTGQTILFRNPLNGRRFPARVVGPGRASTISTNLTGSE